VAGLGTVGYATRRDLSSWYRVLFWALLALLVFGTVAIFVSIPQVNLIWSVAGFVVFGGYTILDFNRLRRAGTESAVPIVPSSRAVPAPTDRETREQTRVSTGATCRRDDQRSCRHQTKGAPLVGQDRTASGRHSDPPFPG
jgi:Inhibitor of apoptosis-promoting Bax1